MFAGHAWQVGEYSGISEKRTDLREYKTEVVSTGSARANRLKPASLSPRGMAKSGPRLERPQGYQIRELRAADLDRGFLETLGNLSDLEGLTSKEAHQILKAMKHAPLYRVLVALAPGGQVIGATTLLLELKFIHRGGLVGHIEDVVVRKGYEGRGVGGSLVKTAIELAREAGCYKCVLDCKAELVGFYERLGMGEQNVGMRVDLRPSSSRKPKRNL